MSSLFFEVTAQPHFGSIHEINEIHRFCKLSNALEVSVQLLCNFQVLIYYRFRPSSIWVYWEILVVVNEGSSRGACIGVLGEISPPPGPPWEVAVLPQLIADQQKYHRIHDFSYTTVIKMLSTLVYILVCVFFHHACQNWLWILYQICPFCQLQGLVNKSQNHHCQEYCSAFSSLL